MDPRLLDYYNRELAYLRELGQEFAEQYPKVASRLGMHGVEVADPYVERLLEGFSFLTARIQLKMDAEFPRFSQRLLEIFYPNYVAPTPAMAIVQLKPKMSEGSLAAGFMVPKDSVMHSGIGKGMQTACEFRTGHDVMLWPLEIAEASATAAPADLPITMLPVERPIKGALRLRLKTVGELKMAQLNLDSLTFFLNGTDDIASTLYENLFAHSLGIIGCEPQRPVRWMEFLPPDHISPEGFEAGQAMLPYHARAFQGYRLLHEYFAFPSRYQFFTLRGLKKMVTQCSGNTLDLTVLLDCPAGELEYVVDKKQFALFCTPAINLFPKRGDRIAVGSARHEHHVVIDRTRPLDYEVYMVNNVIGHGEEASVDQVFRPFYASLEGDDGGYGAYYAVRREPRVMSDAGRRHGTRTNYVGSEVFLSLVDQREAPYSELLRHLSIDTLCTNRDLALLIPVGGHSDFTLTASAPVEAVNILRGPSKPVPALAENAITWRLISHLNLNYLTMTDLNAAEGAQALRELLSLYGLLSDLALKKQIDAVQRSEVKMVTRRLPQKGPIVFGRGVAVDVTVDEGLFAGTSPFLFGAVLEQFFARHVSINVFTETTLRSLQRGEIMHWKPRIGKRPTA